MNDSVELLLDDKPREKLAKKGAAALTDSELLSILLGSGNANVPLQDLADSVLDKISILGNNLCVNELQTLYGIGLAKSTTIVAAIEFGRRQLQSKQVKICSARDVYQVLAPWVGKLQEHFLSLTLNGANEVIETRVVTIGLVNSTQVHPREVFADAVCDRAASIIVAHNHPSGDLTPSKEDNLVTERLVAAGNLLGIRLLDHLIVSKRGYYSFQEQGML